MKYSLSAIVALACKPGAPLRRAKDPGKGRSPREQSEPGDVLDTEFARTPICAVARRFLGTLFADSRQRGTAGVELVIDDVRRLSSPRNPRSSALLVSCAREMPLSLASSACVRSRRRRWKFALILTVLSSSTFALGGEQRWQWSASFTPGGYDSSHNFIGGTEEPLSKIPSARLKPESKRERNGIRS